MQTEKVIVVDADKCTGCRVCELVCSMFKRSECNPNESFIRLMTNEEAGVYIPTIDVKCDFCAKCVQYCPSKALTITGLEDAIVMRRGVTIGSFPIPIFAFTES